MKLAVALFCLLGVSAGAYATPTPWTPGAGHKQIDIWPGKAPDLKPMPGPEKAWTGTRLLAGKTITAVTNVSVPTITLYTPKGTNTGTAVVVYPGGGFTGLAMNLEGTEACDWLNSIGVTCVLLKYRTPSLPYDWHCKCRPHNHMVPTQSLEDAQRTMGLLRLHAKEWGIDPHKIGVLGFSAGGFVMAEISTHYKKRLYQPIDAADKESMRPDFAIGIYPGHIAMPDWTLNPNVPVTKDTPPTFLVQAEDDYVDGVQQSLVYYTALAKAKVPSELHIYAHGGHAFGLRPTKDPITHWPNLAEAWMRRIGMLPKQ